MTQPGQAPSDYTLLLQQARALISGESHYLPNLANTAALLWEALSDINWCGFYLTAASGDTPAHKELILGPFQGKPACIRIPFGKGVCGTAALQDTLQLVEDVHCFPGHIACDSASASEIVIPIHGANGAVVAVLDIDSPLKARFTTADADGLTALTRLLETGCCFDFKDLT
ncbi:MAG: GAF domain-containing protein [Lachnospiraceae bacterium]|nr:GAF domain-containing protein [Lachnospiraceae bacterium]